MSSPAVASSAPSGEKATAFTALSCPDSGGPTGRPVAVSQSRAVVSWLPVASRRPSREYASASTLSE
ncbi:hypothetical protein OG756_05590 [Streptomyces sp. NBC_01310]|nr:hypothetical protein OG756_05590 [Streptomyces sp. NBC_01310]